MISTSSILTVTFIELFDSSLGFTSAIFPPVDLRVTNNVCLSSSGPFSPSLFKSSKSTSETLMPATLPNLPVVNIAFASSWCEITGLFWMLYFKVAVCGSTVLVESVSVTESKTLPEFWPSSPVKDIFPKAVFISVKENVSVGVTALLLNFTVPPEVWAEILKVVPWSK